MSDFFAMDGYAFFIWASWGVSAAALLGLFLWVLMERRAANQRLHQLEEDEA
jgi:heme exporter protein CcmD